MKKNRWIYLTGWTIGLLLAGALQAQHQELNEKPGLWKGREPLPDTNSLLSAFRRGSMSGHFRYFFMSTRNATGLTDYHAHAAGGGIKFETARFKNFQLGISGFFVFNIGSSDLTVPDPQTGQRNRYEVGLFDIENPENKNDIDRLEELYLKYHLKKGTVTFGRQLLNTPFINLQDGRMRPTEVEGLWTDWRPGKKSRLEAGWLYGISPRSTVRWFSVAGSMGVYPAGVNTDGQKSGYAGHLNSRGVLLTGYTWQHEKGWKWQAWNQFTENIFNSVFLQADREWELTGKSKWLAAAQVIRQDAIGNGGNNDPARAYLPRGHKAWAFGARTGYKTETGEITLNYTRITAHGRYLMPREWGRDPFFTFLPRERNEGLGDVQAWVLKATRTLARTGLKITGAAGFYQLPEVDNFRLNKYGMPSYRHYMVDLRYPFRGWLQGLEGQLLYLYKDQAGKKYLDPKFEINRVNMGLWNLVFNYHF